MSFVLLGILNSQAAAGDIDPADLNPDLWLDASDASTITASSGSVSQWNNKGTLENLTQVTSAEQPTTGVTTLNGLNVIDFNDEWLEGSTASEWKFLHDGTNYFFCIVAKVIDNDTLESYFGTFDSSGDVGALVFYKDASPDTNKLEIQIGRGVGGSFAVRLQDQNFISPSTFGIISSLLDPDNATASDRVEYYLNETQGTETNADSGAVSTSNPTHNLAVGNAHATSALSFVGSIAELIIVSGANATEENRQEIVNYLNAKWSVF